MATDLQYLLMQNVKTRLLTSLPDGNGSPLKSQSVLIVDRDRHIDQLFPATYIQIWDASGDKPYASAGGNEVLEWQMGISIRQGLQTDAPNIYVLLTQMVRQISINVLALVHLQYALDPVDAPEPARVTSITPIKPGLEVTGMLAEALIEHRYRLLTRYPLVES